MNYLESNNDKYIGQKIKCHYCGSQIDWSKKVAINLKEQFFCKDCFVENYTWRPRSTAIEDSEVFKTAGRWSEARWITEPLAFVPFEDKFNDINNPKYELYWKSRIIDVVEEYMKIKTIKQISSIMIRANNYVTKNKFTFKGIYYSLLYHYKIKKGDPSKAKNNIGIVPFIYSEATGYWITIFKRLEMKNKRLQKLNKEQNVKILIYQGSEYEVKNSWKNLERENTIKELKEEMGTEYNKMEDILKEMRSNNETKSI